MNQKNHQSKWPFVSVIVPCYNEERTIPLLLDAIKNQTYPGELIEVVISDAMSTDNTRKAITDYQKNNKSLKIKVIDNPARTIPAAVNGAVDAAKGDYIVRLDAHSIPCATYIESSIKALLQGKGENVGGVWNIQASDPTWIAESIAAAASHPLGVGDALYRYTTKAGYVDTVPFGAFSKKTFYEVGKFDESLLSNEDYEFNARIRGSGGRIWLDPEIQCVYFARSNFSKLAAQYRRYGFWKLQMLKKYPQTLRWRQALPPLFVLVNCIFGIASAFLPIIRWILLGELSLYLLILLISSLPKAIKKRNFKLLIGIPLAIFTMHFSWGAGFLVSIFKKNSRVQ